MTTRSPRRPPRPTSVVTRAVGAVLALVLGGAVAVPSALDRLAASGVVVGLFEPLLTGTNGLAARAWLALGRGQASSAEALARQAARREPLNQAALRTLGLALAAQGQGPAADHALRAAGELGWRDPVTQLYWAGVAARAGEVAVAAERYDAVLRNGSSGVGQAVVGLRALEQTAGGRRALADRMADPGEWHAAYLESVDGLSDAGVAARVALLRTVQRRDRPLDDAALGRLTRSLLNTKHDDAALAVSALLPQSDPFAFVPDGAPASPFRWALLPAGGLDLRVEGTGSATTLIATPATDVLTPLVTLVTPASRADRILGFAVAGASTDRPLLLSVGCGVRSAGVVIPPLASQGGWVRVRLPGATCALQQVALSVPAAEAASGSTLRIGSPVVAGP